MLDTIKQKFDDKISIPIDMIQERMNFELTLRSLEIGFEYEKKFLRSL